MDGQLKYRQIAFVVMVATRLLAVGSLFFLGRSEAAAEPVPRPQRLFISRADTTRGDGTPYDQALRHIAKRCDTLLEMKGEAG